MAIGVMEAEIPTIVLARNVGDETYTIRHNKRKFDIIPGGELHLPWDALASFLGDPRVMDVGRNKFRRVLYDQMRAVNNFQLGFDTETRKQATEKQLRTGIETHSWEERRPPIEVYTIEGQRIYMLIDDPTGEEENPWGRMRAPEDSSNTSLLEAQVARLQSQLDQLSKVLIERANDSLPAALAEPAPEVVPIDLSDTSDDLTGAPVPPPTTTSSPIPASPSLPPNLATGRPPSMDDGIRTDLMPLRPAALPTVEQLFNTESDIPTASEDTATIKPDRPKATKPVAPSIKAGPRPKSPSSKG